MIRYVLDQLLCFVDCCEDHSWCEYKGLPCRRCLREDIRLRRIRSYESRGRLPRAIVV